ncbi:MAG: replicative DNA helicase, partial [Steroidobacteraceae bacterium]
PNGIREVFRVRLTSGRQVQATVNHPFLTYDGWRPLGDITVGGRVAVPRHTPGPLARRPMPEPEIIMLAQLLGDGSFVRSQPILPRHEKFIPPPIFSLPGQQVALFVRHHYSQHPFGGFQ